MPDNHIAKAVAGTCVTFSFVLAGNAVTQSFMTVPALLVNFPPPNSPLHAERARLLGRQWPLCWTVGNRLFRPISMFGFLGYAYTAFAVYMEGDKTQSKWWAFALAAALHFITIVHSAKNMQPLNDKLEALAERASEQELKDAEKIASKWGRWNLVRLATPVIAGTLALWQSVA